MFCMEILLFLNNISSYTLKIAQQTVYCASFDLELNRENHHPVQFNNEKSNRKLIYFLFQYFVFKSDI